MLISLSWKRSSSTARGTGERRGVSMLKSKVPVGTVGCGRSWLGGTKPGGKGDGVCVVCVWGDGVCVCASAEPAARTALIVKRAPKSATLPLRASGTPIALPGLSLMGPPHPHMAPAGALLPLVFPTLGIRPRRYEDGSIDQYLRGNRDATRICPFVTQEQPIF